MSAGYDARPGLARIAPSVGGSLAVTFRAEGDARRPEVWEWPSEVTWEDLWRAASDWAGPLPRWWVRYFVTPRGWVAATMRTGLLNVVWAKAGDGPVSAEHRRRGLVDSVTVVDRADLPRPPSGYAAMALPRGRMDAFQAELDTQARRISGPGWTVRLARESVHSGDHRGRTVDIAVPSRTTVAQFLQHRAFAFHPSRVHSDATLYVRAGAVDVGTLSMMRWDGGINVLCDPEVTVSEIGLHHWTVQTGWDW